MAEYIDGGIEVIRPIIRNNVSVWVKNTSGQAIENATVVFSFGNRSRTVYTNSIGIASCLIPNVEVISIECTITKDGYNSTSVTIEYDPDEGLYMEEVILIASQTPDPEPEPESKTYYYNILVIDNDNDNPISGVGVKLYKNIGTTPWKKYKCNYCGYVYGDYYLSVIGATCPNCGNQIIVEQTINTTTNANGFISIPMENQISAPSNIYARIDDSTKPEGYEDGEEGNYVVPMDNESTPGCTIALTPIQPDYYTFHFRFIDKISKFAIGNMSVRRGNVGNSFSIGTVDGYGNYVYTTTDISFELYIPEQSGYKSFHEQYTYTSGSYYEIELEPKNTIRVMDGDIPKGNIRVKITYKENNEDREWTFVTFNEDDNKGYIQTLSSTVYDSGNKYWVEVIGYSSIGKYILPGDNILDVSQIPDSGDEPVIPDDTDRIVKSVYGNFEEVSVKNIKEHINIGNEVLEEIYKNNYNNEQIDVEGNKVSYKGGNDYRIKIVDPDSINVYDIFEGTYIDTNDSQNSIGSMDIKLKDDPNELRLKIINRYSGYYNPIFKDILFYNNMVTKDGVKCPYSNTSFDYNYKDNYGKFGVINNMWFHKANDNKKIRIINTTEPYYPLTGQYALDSRDYNIFETNWDNRHYTKQVDVETSQPCDNISSMKDGLCMFGSKYLNVPETIEINYLTLGLDSSWNGEWNDDYITQPKMCPGEIMFKEVNGNSVDFYIFLKKRIIRFFQEILYDEFKKYISNQHSFGNKEGIEDDIEEYVEKNILKLYRLERVRVFVRRIKRGIHDSKIENNYGAYLDKNVTYFRQHGFVETNNVRLTKINTDAFDRKLVYNLKTGYQEDFGFAFILRKI